MTKGRILLKLILDEIGLGEPRLDSFAKRLGLQKKVYLVQVAGLDLQYRYNWYLRGPYCAILTDNAFLLKEEIDSGEDDYTGYVLSDKARKRLTKAMGIWELGGEVDSDEEEWLELLASLHYLKQISYLPGGRVAKEQIFEKLMDAKPKFRGKEAFIQMAWDRLGEFGLVDKKVLA